MAIIQYFVLTTNKSLSLNREHISFTCERINCKCEQTQKCSKHHQILPVRWFILPQIDATDFTANYKEGTCLLPPAWGMTTNGDRSAEVKTQERELFFVSSLMSRGK